MAKEDLKKALNHLDHVTSEDIYTYLEELKESCGSKAEFTVEYQSNFASLLSIKPDIEELFVAFREEFEATTPKNSDEENLLTTEDVAKRLNLNPKTIQNYIHHGKIIATKMGGKYRIREKNFRDFYQRT